MSSARSRSVSMLTQTTPARSERRAETLGKAVELFARRGFAQVGLRELATHMGISAGSIYHHIESKEALLLELIEELYTDLLNIVTPPRSLRKPISGEQRLSKVILDHLDLHLNRSDYFRVAEHDFRCLSQAHQQTILTLRERYEMHLHTMVLTLNIGQTQSVTQSAARSLVCLLNNLPFSLSSTDLDPAQRRLLLARMIMGAIMGALAE